MKHWDKYDLGGVFDVFDFDKKMALINLDMIYEYAVKLDTIVTEESQLEEWVKMKLTRIEQNVSDVAHSLEGWEKFDEGGMIFKKQLLSISKYAHKLIEMIKGGSKLMSWQENKLAISANDIDNLYHHLDYKVGNRASQNKFATGGMMKYPDLSNETPIVINEPNNQKISEIDIALIDIALVRQDLGIEKTKIGSSNDAYQIFKQLWNKDSINVREEMNVLFLNNANEPIGYYEHTKGAINSTLVDVEMIGALALKTLSKGVILAHNHPSGNNKPSEADIKLYQQVKTALKMFNVTVLDSMILVPNSDNYYSLADNGYEMGGMVLSNKEIIKNIDFSDNTDRRLGRYDFSFETEDSEGASILDYDGYIIEAPSSSRMNDEIEWGQNVPEDWENAEKYILDEFYNWKKRFKTGGGVGDIQISVKNGGAVKTDFNELENTKLRNVLISFWNDFFNNHIANYLSIEKENYILSNIDNVFVIVRDKDKGNFSDVEKQKIDIFLSPYFDSGKKPLFSDFFVRYEIKDNKIIIHIKEKNMYSKGGSVYRIVEGYDHYKGMPLYNVIGDNDYVGEYHTDRKDAEKELQELNKGVDIKLYALWSDGMRNKKRQEILSVGYWKGRVSKHQPTIENIKEFLSQVPFDESIAIYTDDDTSFYGELHSAYTPLYTAGAKSVDAIVDSNDNIIWNKYEGSKYFLNPSDYMEKGGGVGEYKVGDKFIGTPNAKYDASWQLHNPSTSYVINNKTNEILSIHKTPYEAIEKRDSMNPNFKLHFEIHSKEYSKGGKINSGREAMFKSQEPHEQRYKRKREWKEYKKEGWFGDWYEKGGDISSELSEPQKEFSKSAEMLVRENLQNGEICMCKLKKILGHEPNYPKQVIGSLVLEKAYLRNYYKI